MARATRQETIHRSMRTVMLHSRYLRLGIFGALICVSLAAPAFAGRAEACLGKARSSRSNSR